MKHYYKGTGGEVSNPSSFEGAATHAVTALDLGRMIKERKS